MTTIKILDPSNKIRIFTGAIPMQSLVKDLMSRTDWVILDTETTGLDNRAECVSIGVVDHAGNVLLDTLVKPTIPITADVTAINGVTNEMLADAAPFNVVLDDLYLAVKGKTIVVYNAPYDRRIIAQSYEPYRKHTLAHGLNPFGPADGDMMADIMSADWVDVMAPYAEYWGDYSDWHHSYKWQKLTIAAKQQRVPIVNAHRAVGDCLMTLGVIKAVYEREHGKQ